MYSQEYSETSFQMGRSFWPKSFQACLMEFPLEQMRSICCKSPKSQKQTSVIIDWFFLLPSKDHWE